MRRTLIDQGYPAEQIDVVRQAMPAAEQVWDALGRDRAPGRAGGPLTVAFFGSAYSHKGPQLLVEAAQRADCDVRVQIHGEVPAAFARSCEALDARGAVELSGNFAHDELPALLAGVDVAALPSLWWDCAPLVAAECLAGRVPLLAPRMGGLAEAVRDEVDGLVFDGLDADGLARQLERLAGEEGLLERLQAGIEAPRPFADYVDELEAYYAGASARRALRSASRARPSRWVGDHDAPTSLSSINRACASGWRQPLSGVAARRPHARPAAAARRRRRGAPPVAAGPAPAGLGPAGADPAVGVRRRPDATGSSRSARTSTSSGCRASTCARCTSRPASIPSACRSCPTASTSSASAPTARRCRSTTRAGCASCSSAARSPARASTCCSPPTARPSPAATT